MPSIYALLVGINDYSKAGAANLGGCLDDIAFYESFLRERYPEALKLETRKDSEATRDNIVAAFRSHLSKAEKDDVALFIYAGHGARWKSAPEFARFPSDGYDEGLVCYDSRSESGKYDLADKELAMLLQEVAANDPHIAVILDSCHSGSATRSVDALEGARTRATLTVNEARPFDSYLDGQYVKRSAENQDFVLPESKHILLAACSRTQEALEMNGRGNFSRNMESVLNATGGNVSYADLYSRCRAAMR
ncbi:MAG: caspase family protein, partial [Rhodothermales bacterium]|nr:caspase family protein [Rhodothermales bacterium]